jgi:hypothetical protein
LQKKLGAAMIYKTHGYELDLSKITRLYPAVRVDVHGEFAQVSLEWAELNHEKVKLSSYLLVFDFDPLGELVQNRVELLFDTKEELFEEIYKVDEFVKSSSR